jgi:hypothetical protein
MTTRTAFLLAALAAGGCGSSHSGSSGDAASAADSSGQDALLDGPLDASADTRPPCAATPGYPGVATFYDNTVFDCATITAASRTTSSTQDALEISGGTDTGIGFSLTVVTYAPPLQTGRQYTCMNDAGSALYVGFTYPGTLVDCTITIDNPGGPGGVHATGTFSAAFNANGGTDHIASGVFDTVVTIKGS